MKRPRKEVLQAVLLALVVGAIYFAIAGAELWT